MVFSAVKVTGSDVKYDNRISVLLFFCCKNTAYHCRFGGLTLQHFSELQNHNLCNYSVEITQLNDSGKLYLINMIQIDNLCSWKNTIKMASAYRNILFQVKLTKELIGPQLNPSTLWYSPRSPPPSPPAPHQWRDVCSTVRVTHNNDLGMEAEYHTLTNKS